LGTTRTGHDVSQVPPVYAKFFRQSHKHDFGDAYTIAEAVQHQLKANQIRSRATTSQIF